MDKPHICCVNLIIITSSSKDQLWILESNHFTDLERSRNPKKLYRWTGWLTLKVWLKEKVRQ